MREDDERFLSIAENAAALLASRGMKSEDSILDIGSGYGRLAFGLIRSMHFTGRYQGFDILPRHVQWCRETITPMFPNFSFDHLDVVNDRYNPQGTIHPADVRFPYPDASFAFCSLFSVFTHMYESEIRHYAEEIQRVLTPNGRCVATFFLYDRDRRDAVMSASAAMPMSHVLNDVTMFFSESDPLHAICYDIDHVQTLWRDAGFTLESVQLGSWAGDHDAIASDPMQPSSFQDVITVSA